LWLVTGHREPRENVPATLDSATLAHGIGQPIARWIEQLNAALAVGTPERLAELFSTDAHWRTKQPGLWFTGGAFSQCSIYSKILALQIKATELGLL
jgi:hypothetical protein